MNGSDTSTRTADNIDEVGLNYAEIKALASGNPLLKDKAMIDVEVCRLAILKQQYNANQYRLQDSIAIHLPKRIAQLDENIELWQADIMKRNKSNVLPFKITLKDKRYEEKSDAASILQGYISSLPFNGNQVCVGSYRGFELIGESR